MVNLGSIWAKLMPGHGLADAGPAIDVPALDIRGTQLPVIGFGTSGLHGRRCTAMVQMALKIGYRYIDTAQAYGNETEVGRGLARSGLPREEIFLATKFEQANLGAAAVRREIAASLGRLGTSYVDLLMIHWPSKDIALKETLTAFAELREEGLIRHIGVCNFTLRLLREAVEEHGAELLCNQIEYHPLLAQKTVLPYLQSQRIAARHGKSTAQIALAWLASQDLVSAIPKASSAAHCRANLEIFDVTLSAEELAEIAALDRGERVIDPSWAPAWD